MPASRGGDRREFLVLAVCLAVSGALFAFGGRVDPAWIARSQYALLWPANRVRDFLEEAARDHRENENLRMEVAKLRAERLLLLRAGAEYERLRRALAFAEPRGPVLRAASVWAVGGEPWPLSYQLSIGKRQGVKLGQPVVVPEGLVGRITDATRDHSTVTLLTDPTLAVACEVIPSGVRGVLRFRAEERPGLYLLDVPLTDTVRMGEEVATSGLSQFFPEGLPVGVVERVARDPDGLVQDIRVRPYARFTRLREVFIVLDSERLGPWQVPPAEPSSRGVPSPKPSSRVVPPDTSSRTAPPAAGRP
jgi:rod shape-determining protein MreC